MKITSNRSLLNWILITVSFFMVSLILWNTYQFYQKFKDEEYIKMENFSAAQIELSKTLDLDGNISDLPLKIIQSNTTTPMIIEDSEGNFQSKNISPNLFRPSTQSSALTYYLRLTTPFAEDEQRRQFLQE